MDQIGVKLIEQWGVIGLIILILICICGFLGYLLFQKNNKTDGKDNFNGGLNLIISSIDSMKTSISEQIDVIHERIDLIEESFDNKISYLDKKIDKLPKEHIDLIDNRNRELNNFTELIHLKALSDVSKLGPKIYDLLNEYCVKINCNHLFIGSFHNGSSDLNGFPYIKMNIIREAYHPSDLVETDHPFAPVYKDCDLSLLGKIPSLLIQNKLLYFVVEDLNSEMFKYDNLIGRRMLGMGIKQIALLGLFDDNNKISGFIGCVRYDLEEMNLSEIKLCSKDLELLHNDNEE